MEMVTVKTFDNYFTANILLTRLQQAGIPCYLRDEYSVTINPILGNAIGGIKLNVHKADSKLVEELLKQFDEEYLKTALCPTCGGNHILLVPKPEAGNVLTAIFTWLFSSYAVSVENVYQCQQCGYESKIFPENNSIYN